MKVTLRENSLLIEAETEFEEDWCAGFIRHGETGVAFLKCGLTVKDVLGIVVGPPVTKEPGIATKEA